jgi:hypothetical protein
VTLAEAGIIAIGVSSFSAIGCAVAVGIALLGQRGLRAMDVRLADGKRLTITNRMPAEEIARRVQIIEQGLASFKTAPAANPAPARAYAGTAAGLEE